MDWREWAETYLTHERARLIEQIDVMSSGKCQLWTMTAGEQRKDITAEHVDRLRGYLEEIERILAEAGVSLES